MATLMRPTADQDASLARRAAVHHALGDVHRLAIADALMLTDATPSELAVRLGLSSNLLAFHLDVLEAAGLIERAPSEGDGRRRYVRLRPVALPGAIDAPQPAVDDVLFVCTANSARSQLAAALWQRATGRPARSAGATPAAQVDPLAVEVASSVGLTLDGAQPRGYDAVEHPPELIVSVCDRAHEAGLPFDVPTLHWSIPDPVGGDVAGFRAIVDELETRIAWLAGGPRRGA